MAQNNTGEESLIEETIGEEPILPEGAGTIEDPAGTDPAPWYVARRENLPYGLLALVVALAALLAIYRMLRTQRRREQEAAKEWRTVRDRARQAGLTPGEEAALVAVLSETDLADRDDAVLTEAYFDAFVARPLAQQAGEETMGSVRRKLYGSAEVAPAEAGLALGPEADRREEESGRDAT